MTEMLSRNWPRVAIKEDDKQEKGVKWQHTGEMTIIGGWRWLTAVVRRQQRKAGRRMRWAKRLFGMLRNGQISWALRGRRKSEP